jgi:hypothetical protein
MTPAGNRRGFVAGLLGSSLLGLTGDNSAAQAARGSERPRSSLEVADFVTGTVDHAAAASAAFATLPPEGGELVFGPGVWLLDRPLHFDGKPIRIRGAGNGVTVLAVRHRGTAISAAQNRLADLAHMTSINDLTLRMIAPGAADCAIAISYAESRVGPCRPLRLKMSQSSVCWRPAQPMARRVRRILPPESA